MQNKPHLFFINFRIIYVHISPHWLFCNIITVNFRLLYYRYKNIADLPSAVSFHSFVVLHNEFVSLSYWQTLPCCKNKPFIADLFNKYRFIMQWKYWKFLVQNRCFCIRDPNLTSQLIVLWCRMHYLTFQLQNIWKFSYIKMCFYIRTLRLMSKHCSTACSCSIHVLNTSIWISIYHICM